MEMSHLRLISTIETLLLKPIKMFRAMLFLCWTTANKRAKEADVRNEFLLSIEHCHFCDIY